MRMNLNSITTVPSIDPASLKVPTKKLDVPEIKTAASNVPNPPTSSKTVQDDQLLKFLNKILRDNDSNHFIGVKPSGNKSFKNIPVSSINAAIREVLTLSNQGHDVYFALADYATPNNRKTENALSARAFWMDIDCGGDKAASGKGYQNQEEARRELERFCLETGLPQPNIIVNSGSGLHVYWILDAPVEKTQWQRFATKLKALTQSKDFKADHARTTDIASVLRVPGTLNQKYVPAKPVKLLELSEDDIECSTMLDAIDRAHQKFCQRPTSVPTEVTPSAADKPYVGSKFSDRDFARLKSALQCLDTECDEATWKFKRIAPLAELAANYPDYAERLKQLAMDWSSGKLAGKPSIAWTTPGKTKGLTGEQAFPGVWERFLSGNYSGKPATLGTIFHDAKEVGWVDITQSGLVVVKNQSSPLTVLHQGQSIEANDFPNPPKPGKSVIPTTIPNVNYLLERYGIISRYNVIKKKIEITVPDHSGTSENHDNVAMAHIISLAALNGLNTGLVPEFVAAIADQHPINPVADWISCKAWDGDDRLQALYATLSTADDYPSELKEILVYRWLVSAVAAVLKPSGFKGRGVLTLQGPQSIGKTSWISALVPDPILREQVIKLDHHLDAANKDSIITAVSHWIVEIGELDSSFKKDIARLKGFLTSNQDKIRKPYGRTNSEYPRKTVFCASVNDANFLVDSTGNTRWWTIPVVSVNYKHNIDMQQIFAQIAEDVKAGERWWLTSEEEARLENFNRRHRSISVIEDRIMAGIDLERTDEANFPAMTPSQFLIEIGLSHPTNAQCKEGAAIFRELFGDSKRINGQNKWRIPVKKLLYPGIRS